jgi:NADH-quinone oxidoreductase subunit L
VVIVIGAITALFMGLVALTQFDIKRVVAYSTLSQLGYMTVALGASAYSAAMFHLATHAFFKAVLFLAAGSVIIAMHHEQDMRRMGGLKKYMPWTYWTLLIGAIASAGIPALCRLLLQGRDHRGGAACASHGRDLRLPRACCLACSSLRSTPSAWCSWFPRRAALRHRAPAARVTGGGDGAAVLLAIPSIGRGMVRGQFVFGDYFLESLVREKSSDYHGHWAFTLHGLTAVPFCLPWRGIATAWYLYRQRTDLPKKIAMGSGRFTRWSRKSNGFDELYSWLFAQGARAVGTGLWKGGDQRPSTA